MDVPWRVTRRHYTRRQAALATVTAFASGAALAGCGTAAVSATKTTAQKPIAGAAPAAAPAAFPQSQLVVAAPWLAQHLMEQGLRVVDTRPAADYDRAHIPGAVNLPVGDTFDTAQPRNYPAPAAALAALLARKGIGTGVRVVAYDNGAETPAARLLWTLEYLGHTGAAVLDGGLKAWQAGKGDLALGATAAPDVATAPLTAMPNLAVLHTQRQCEAALGDKGTVMVDARSPEEYRGEDVRAKFGGRIPGAINVDWREHFRADSLVKDPAALAALYQTKGITKDREAVAYCQTGQRAAVTYWALRLLGYPRVANYAGSWIEWGNDPTTPKAQGP